MNRKVATGLALAAVAIGLLILGPVAVLLAYCLYITGAMVEFYRLVETKNVKPMKAVGIAFGVSFVALGFAEMVGPKNGFVGQSVATVLTVYIMAVLIIQFYQILRNNIRYSFIDLSVTVFGSLYIGGLSGYLFLVWSLGAERHPGQPFFAALMLVIPMWGSWGSDAFAYFTGRHWGKTRIFPTISKKKTLEGTLGGALAGALGVGFIGMIVGVRLPHGLFLGALCGLMGQIGDLCESTFKRELDVKDSGGLFGEHGGFLDRIDSFLFALPTAFYYLVWFEPWSG